MFPGSNASYNFIVPVCQVLFPPLKIRLSGVKPKDLKGKTFNYLEVLHIDNTKPKGSGKHAYWICKCLKCGNTKSIRSSDLILGNVIDCGCERHKRISDGVAKDLSGMIFGHLHVLEKDWENFRFGGGNHTRWLCKCDLCGRIESNSSDMLTIYGKDRCKYCAGIVPILSIKSAIVCIRNFSPIILPGIISRIVII